MSKECPSCHREFRYLLQCTDCRMMFCNRCADQKFALIPIQFSKYDPGPGFVSICPKCGGGYDVLVDDDDCEESTDDRDSASDRSGASDQEEASNESSYSSSDYSGSAGGDWGGGIVALVVIAICWFLASSKYEGYQEWTRARHTYQATADAERVRNTRAANAPTPTYTQPRNIRPFESTVFGTYNWDKDQSLAQSNKLETENQGPVGEKVGSFLDFAPQRGEKTEVKGSGLDIMHFAEAGSVLDLASVLTSPGGKEKATFPMTRSRTGEAQVWRVPVKKRSCPLSIFNDIVLIESFVRQ